MKMKRLFFLVSMLPALCGATGDAAPSETTSAAGAFRLALQPFSPGNFAADFSAFYHGAGEWFAANSMLLSAAVIGLSASALSAWVLRWIFTIIFLRFRRGASHYYERTMRAVRRPLVWFFFTIGALFSLLHLANAISPAAGRALGKGAAALITLLFVWMILRLLGVFYEYLLERPATDRSMNLLLVNLLRRIIKTVILLLALLFIGQSIFGLNITALLAGAGVIGLAVALAAQDTLANFFGSIMILADKPFTVGDRVRFGAIDGFVEYVGFRSTRIRALDGNIFQAPNRQLVDGVLENVSRRPDIKYVFDIGLIYRTTPEQMEQALGILHEILDHHPAFDMLKHPPAIQFTEFREWSLNINVVVWFNTVNFQQAQSWKTRINLEILRRFNNAGLRFAIPSATRYLAAENGRPLEIKGGAAEKKKKSVKSSTNTLPTM